MDEREKIIKQFFADATPEELNELKKLLDERKKSPVPGSADFHKIAGKVAKPYKIPTKTKLTED